MAKKEPKAFIVNVDKKVIIIDDSVKRSAALDKDLALYVGAGYVIRHKSKKRAEKAIERADKLSDKDIKEALKDNKSALAEYESIKKSKGKGGGFFAAKKWYKDNFGEKK